MPEINLTASEIVWATFAVSLIIGLIVKEIATSLVMGLLFKLNPQFQEGDVVLLDDKRAVIIKVGIRNTVFQFENEHGTVWRYVPNTTIKNVKLEKIVTPKHPAPLED